MKRIAFLIFPFLVLFSITLQNFSYLVQSSMEAPLFLISDSADEKNAEGKETKKLDSEQDDKFVSSPGTNIQGRYLLDPAYRFHCFPTDHIIEVNSPPPEMA